MWNIIPNTKHLAATELREVRHSLWGDVHSSSAANVPESSKDSISSAESILLFVPLSCLFSSFRLFTLVFNFFKMAPAQRHGHISFPEWQVDFVGAERHRWLFNFSNLVFDPAYKYHVLLFVKRAKNPQHGGNNKGTSGFIQPSGALPICISLRHEIKKAP